MTQERTIARGAAPGATGGTGVLAIWHDIEADPEETRELFEWYGREHHPERFDVPGFLRARRYEALSGEPRIFARYDTVNPEVMRSDAYLARVNDPSPWTTRVMPRYRNMCRTVCRVVHRFGRGEGGKLAAVRFEAGTGGEAALLDAVARDVVPGLAAAPGIVGGQLIAAAGPAQTAGSEEIRLRGGPDRQIHCALLVTGYDREAVAGAGQALAGPRGLAAHGAAPGARWGLYELVFDLV